MKKFFKALALVLALALVIGVVPAQATSAKVKGTKKLYVGGAQGKSADGKLTSSIKNKVAIYKLAGYTKATKEGHKFTAEVQKDNGIVKITKNYVVAQKLGKALVDIYVDGEKVGTTTINSKINATEDTLQILCNGEAMPEEFVVAGKYTFTLPRVGKDSDERRLYINGELVADDADHPRTYTHTFTKSEEGDVTFKFEAYQDAKLDGALVSKEYKAKVVPPKATGVAQTAYNAFEITFDSDIEVGGYYSDVKAWETEQEGVANDVYYKVGGVKIPFSSVKASTPKENVLKVTMFGDFVAKTEYFIDIAGKTFSFVAAGNSAKDVKDIIFTSTEAVAGTDDDIEFKLVNSLGIDITKTALEDTDGTLVFTNTDNTICYVSGYTINIYEVGKSDSITATYTVYDSGNNYTKSEVTAKATIVGVNATPTNFVSAEYSLGGDGYWTGRHYLPLNDDVQVFVRAKFMTGNTATYVRELTANDKATDGKELQVKVADEHYAMITQTAPTTYRIQGVHKGSTSLILFYVNDDNKAVVVGVLPIEVKDARKATKFEWTSANGKSGSPYLNINANARDGVWIGGKLVDQYGDFVPGDRVELKQLDASASKVEGVSDIVLTQGASNYGYYVNGNQYNLAAGVTGEQTVAYSVKTDSGVTTTISFRVKDAGDATAAAGTPDYVANKSYRMVTDSNAIDTSLTGDSWNTANNVEANVIILNGSYYVGDQGFELSSKTFLKTKNANTEYGVPVDGTSFFVRVLRNSNVLPVSAGAIDKTLWVDAAHAAVDFADHIDNSGTVLTFKPFAVDSKLPTGTYTLQLYKVDYKNATSCDVKLVQTQTINVTDAQKYSAPKQDKQSTTESVILDAIKDCYTFYDIKGNKITDESCIFEGATKDNANGSLYVYNVWYTTTYKTDVDDDGTDEDTTYTVIIPINELLSFNQ